MTTKKESTPKSRKPQDVGFFQMLRDVLVASINKGQFPIAILGMIILTMIARMPEQEVAKLVFVILERLTSGSLLGYILWLVTITGWAFHARYQRKIISDEMERLSQERTSLQKQQLGNSIKSSRS